MTNLGDTERQMLNILQVEDYWLNNIIRLRHGAATHMRHISHKQDKYKNRHYIHVNREDLIASSNGKTC